jgi:hypothetical protein
MAFTELPRRIASRYKILKNSRNTNEPALLTGDVLIREFEVIHGTDLSKESDFPKRVEARRRDKDRQNFYFKHVHSLKKKDKDPGQTALCLSGGGIRSAAFALGLMQGLARRGLLSKFHYLSTVSGGGYIGAWLTAWATRARPCKARAN